MSVSSPFIHRPIATSLLGIAVMLGGMLGYLSLPVSSLPQVDFPTIQVTTQLPGASPDVMASLVTAPLERNFGQIPSLQLMTSSSSFGISQITLQFELSRDIDAAAQDIQAAINASAATLPRNLPYPPVYSKVNPADAPMVTLAITSDTISLRALSDVADTLLAQRLSEISGVGRVTVQGIPLAFESGTGSELRNPLGITIIGGLLVSQLLTLYPAPVLYLAMERVKTRL